MGIKQRFTPHSIKFKEARLFPHPETNVMFARLELQILSDAGEPVSSVSLNEQASTALLTEIKKLFKDKTDAIKVEDGLNIIAMS